MTGRREAIREAVAHRRAVDRPLDPGMVPALIVVSSGLLHTTTGTATGTAMTGPGDVVAGMGAQDLDRVTAVEEDAGQRRADDVKTATFGIGIASMVTVSVESASWVRSGASQSSSVFGAISCCGPCPCWCGCLLQLAQALDVTVFHCLCWLSGFGIVMLLVELRQPVYIPRGNCLSMSSPGLRSVSNSGTQHVPRFRFM